MPWKAMVLTSLRSGYGGGESVRDRGSICDPDRVGPGSAGVTLTLPSPLKGEGSRKELL